MPYLRHAIESVLSSARDDFELIVSVNGSRDESLDYLNSLDDSRVRVIRPPDELQMSQHYEFALASARGDWVQIIGSDDGIQGWYFETAGQLILSFPSTQVISWPRAYYYWPGVNPAGDDRLVDSKFSRLIKVKGFNSSFISILFFTKSIFDVPQLYTCSLVKRELLQRIKFESGEIFYHSIIPDVYSSVSLFLNSKTYVFSGLPLTWVGTSPLSMSKDGKIYKENFSPNTKKSLSLARSINPHIHLSEYSQYSILDALSQYPILGAKRDLSMHLFQAATLAAAIIRWERQHIYLLMQPNFQSKLRPLLSMSIILPLSLLLLASYPPIRLINRTLRKVNRLFRFRSEATFRAAHGGDFVGYIGLNAHISAYLSRKGIIGDILK